MQTRTERCVVAKRNQNLSSGQEHLQYASLRKSDQQKNIEYEAMGSIRALTPGKEKRLVVPHDLKWLHQICLQCRGSCQALGRETAARSLQRMPETIVGHLWDQVWLLSTLPANVLVVPSSFQLAPRCWEARWINFDLKIWHPTVPLNKRDKWLLGFEEQVVQLLLKLFQSSAITKIDLWLLLHFLNYMLGDRHTYFIQLVCHCCLSIYISGGEQPKTNALNGDSHDKLAESKTKEQTGGMVCGYESGWSNGDRTTNMPLGMFLPDRIH